MTRPVTRLARDPLLAVARAILLFLMTIMGIGTAALVIAVPAAAVMQDNLIVEMSDQMGTAASPEVVGAIIIILACCAVLLAMIFVALRMLLRIVDTVAAGDPFVPENAVRLTRMAWLMLGVQVVQAPILGLATYIKDLSDKGGRQDIDAAVSLDFSALILVLILFILARVFHMGAAMRDDLEGTV